MTAGFGSIVSLPLLLYYLCLRVIPMVPPAALTNAKPKQSKFCASGAAGCHLLLARNSHFSARSTVKRKNKSHLPQQPIFLQKKKRRCRFSTDGGEVLLRQKRLEHYCSKKRNQNPRWGPIRVIPLYRYVLHTAFASDHYGMPPSQHKRRQPEGRQCVNWTKNGFPRRLYAGSEDKCYTRPTAK